MDKLTFAKINEDVKNKTNQNKHKQNKNKPKLTQCNMAANEKHEKEYRPPVIVKANEIKITQGVSKVTTSVVYTEGSPPPTR